MDGNARAMFNYSLCLRNGLGVPKDAGEAEFWMCQSITSARKPVRSTLEEAVH